MLTTMQAVILEPLHYKKGISHSRHFLEQARILIRFKIFSLWNFWRGEIITILLFNTSKTLTFFLNRIWLIFVSNEFYNGQGDLPTHKTKQNLSDCWFQRNKYVIMWLTWLEFGPNAQSKMYCFSLDLFALKTSSWSSLGSFNTTSWNIICQSTRVIEITATEIS